MEKAVPGPGRVGENLTFWSVAHRLRMGGSAGLSAPQHQQANSWYQHQQGYHGTTPKVPSQEQERGRRWYLQDYGYLMSPMDLDLTGARTERVQDAAKALTGLKMKEPAPPQLRAPPGQAPQELPGNEC